MDNPANSTPPFPLGLPRPAEPSAGENAPQRPVAATHDPADAGRAADAPFGWPPEQTTTPGWYAVPAGQAPGTDPGTTEKQQSPIMRWLSRIWPLLLLGLTKLKWLAVIFKFKAFTTFGSMFLSLWAYALFFGWQFAVGFIALLFIHELGHAAVMRWQGIKTTPILFVPFMGAVIGMREMPRNVFAEAQMALGGPILGTIGAMGCLVLWQVTGTPIFLALAYSGFILNLFNLLPVSPLDGGRAMAAISLWGWLIGLALLLLLFLRVHSLILGFILIVGGMEVFNRWRNRHADRAYYEATVQQRLLVAFVYFGLAAFLGLTLFVLQDHLHLNRPGL